MRHGNPPGVAEATVHSVQYAGHRIRHQLRGRGQVRAFHYYDLDSAAYLSRRNAAIAARPMRFAGFPASLVWLLIQIPVLIGFPNRSAWCCPERPPSPATPDARRPS
jgi:NADH dehydrogenase